MKKAIWVVAAVASLVGCHSQQAQLDAAECPIFENVDVAALPTHLNNDPTNARWEDLWSSWASRSVDVRWKTTAPIATIHIETAAGALSLDGRRKELVGRQSVSGWEIYARTGNNAPPENWSRWRPVALTHEAGRRLTSIIEEPCLWATPRFLDAFIPLKNGRYDARPDGPSTAYDITLGKRRWGGWQFSWSLGAPGELRALLLSEAFADEPAALDQIDPNGNFDEPS